MTLAVKRAVTGDLPGGANSFWNEFLLGVVRFGPIQTGEQLGGDVGPLVHWHTPRPLGETLALGPSYRSF